MVKISAGPRDRAKPTAVPRNGAEHGVASSVAKPPERKCPARPRTRLAPPPTLASHRGSPTSKNPHRLQANSATIRIMAMRNQDCWNWMPQPTAMPAALTHTSAPARSRNETTMPAAEAKKLRLTARRSPPPWPTTPRSLIERTGSTQGMRLRISPPSTARTRMSGSDSVASVTARGTVPGGDATTARVRSAVRAPSTRVMVRRVPAKPVSGAPSTETSRRAPLPPSFRLTLGAENTRSSGPSTYRSGATNGMVALAVTRSTVPAPPSTTSARSMATPWADPSPGTWTAKRLMRWANRLGPAAPAGRRRASFAS